MTQKEKQIKLLEARGWKKEYIDGNGVDDEVWIHPSTNKCWIADIAPLPDYFNNLNACAELEAILTHSQYRKFAETLYFMEYKVERKKPRIIGASRAVLSALAERRAEAIGQALKLW